MHSTVRKDILVALRRIIRAIDLYSCQLMEKCGLTGPQLATLQEIARSEKRTPSDLARELQVSQATISGILDRLENRNYICRARNSDDRRCIEVSATDAGRQALADAPPLLQDRFSQEYARLQD